MKWSMVMVGGVLLALGFGCLGWANTLQVAPDPLSEKIYVQESGLYGDAICGMGYPDGRTEIWMPTKSSNLTGISVKLTTWDNDGQAVIYYKILDQSDANISWGYRGVQLMKTSHVWLTIPALRVGHVDFGTNYRAQVWATGCGVQFIVRWDRDTGLSKYALDVWGSTEVKAGDTGMTMTTQPVTEGTEVACDPLTEHEEDGVCVPNVASSPWKIMAIGIAVIIIIMAAVLLGIGLLG